LTALSFHRTKALSKDRYRVVHVEPIKKRPVRPTAVMVDRPPLTRACEVVGEAARIATTAILTSIGKPICGPLASMEFTGSEENAASVVGGLLLTTNSSA
jgi:hypothetical protein